MTDKYIVCMHSENAAQIRLHRINVLGNYVTNILQEKGNIFSSQAGPVERSPSIIVPDIWITVRSIHRTKEPSSELTTATVV